MTKVNMDAFVRIYNARCEQERDLRAAEGNAGEREAEALALVRIAYREAFEALCGKDSIVWHQVRDLIDEEWG